MAQALYEDACGLRDCLGGELKPLVAQPRGRIPAPGTVPSGPAPNGVITIISLSFVRNPLSTPVHTGLFAASPGSLVALVVRV